MENGDENKLRDLFVAFYNADSFVEILATFKEWKAHIPATQQSPYPHLTLRSFEDIAATAGCHFTLKSVIDTLTKKISSEEYVESRLVSGRRVLIVGAGPGGLKTAIEMALVGCEAIRVIEKRTEFTRNNVLHLWPFSVTDIKSIGGKEMFRKFAVGGIDHISIRRVQIIQLKIALILGVEVMVDEYRGVIPSVDGSWVTVSEGAVPFNLNVLVGCDGENSIVSQDFGFRRKELKFGLAIGITANFIPVSGADNSSEKLKTGGRMSFLNQAFFKKMNEESGIDLENLVYYFDETHYLVMSVRKSCLLSWGIMKEDRDEDLVAPENIDYDKLVEFVKSVAKHQGIPDECPLAKGETSRCEHDIAIFDFSKKLASCEASKLLLHRQNEAPLLVFLAGDSLIAPFWPLGTGLARSSLSAMDLAYMLSRYGDPATWKEKHEELSKVHMELLSKLEASSADSMFRRDAYPLDPNLRYKAQRYTI